MVADYHLDPSMCLVLLAHRVVPGYPLVLAANRDEYFARPASPAAWWSHAAVSIFGGRDLEKGGTWLGVTRGGRFAVVTNVRDGTKPPPDVGSRGWLVRDALAAETLPPVIERERFPTFNLLVGQGDDVYYLADDRDAQRLAPGLYGLSNHRLDTHWPKVDRALAAFRALGDRVDAPSLFRILRDDAVAPDDELPSTGVPLEVERALSPAFVRLPAYGTRCSTVVLLDGEGAMSFEERTFDEAGAPAGVVQRRIL
jgi:uncharacterized protein with NRDE domain